jgi:hypothetical protein
LSKALGSCYLTPAREAKTTVLFPFQRDIFSLQGEIFLLTGVPQEKKVMLEPPQHHFYLLQGETFLLRDVPQEKKMVLEPPQHHLFSLPDGLYDPKLDASPPQTARGRMPRRRSEPLYFPGFQPHGTY